MLRTRIWKVTVRDEVKECTYCGCNRFHVTKNYSEMIPVHTEMLYMRQAIIQAQCGICGEYLLLADEDWRDFRAELIV